MLDIRKAALVGLVTIAMLAAAAASAGASPRAVTSGRSPVAFNREDYWYTSGTGSAARLIANRYGFIVMFDDDARYVAMLHRYNPGLKILMYQYVGYSLPSDPHAGMSCTSYQQDMAHHPNWFVTTPSGGLLTADTHYIMQVGNPAYQQACIGHAISLAKSAGFNGLFLDGVGAKIDYDLPPGLNPHAAQYPTQASWQSAMYSLLTYASSTVHARGLSLFANIGGATAGLWRKWNGPLDGAMEESWTDGGLGVAQQIPWWKEKLQNAAWSQAHGKHVLLHSYNMTASGNTYGLASMMLVAGGLVSYSTTQGGPTAERWYSVYASARRLGAALGAYKHRRNGLYVRRFAHGLVLVNPTSHRIRHVALGGRYSGSGLKRVRSVTLAPLSGLVLTRVH